MNACVTISPRELRRLAKLIFLEGISAGVQWEADRANGMPARKRMQRCKGAWRASYMRQQLNHIIEGLLPRGGVPEPATGETHAGRTAEMAGPARQPLEVRTPGPERRAA